MGVQWIYWYSNTYFRINNKGHDNIEYIVVTPIQFNSLFVKKYKGNSDNIYYK